MAISHVAGGSEPTSYQWTFSGSYIMGGLAALTGK